MRSEEEVRRMLEKLTISMNGQLIVPAYIRGVVDTLRWVLGGPEEPLSWCEAWLVGGDVNEG